MDELEGLEFWGLEVLDVFGQDVVDLVVCEGGLGMDGCHEGKGAVSIASFFEELSFGGLDGGLAGVDPATGAAEQPFPCGMAVFFVDHDFAIGCEGEDGYSVEAEIDRIVGPFGAMGELEKVDADVEEAVQRDFSADDFRNRCTGCVHVSTLVSSG